MIRQNMRRWTRSVCLFALLSGLILHPSRSVRAELDGQIGHIALPSVGRNSGITQIELFPYVMIEDEAIIFANVRGFASNEGKLGGNFGGGFRVLEPNDIFIVGLNAFYDVDQTSGEMYHQVGFGLEALSRFGSVTSNFYFPVGNDDQLLRESRSNARFSGNQLLFDNLRIQGEALSGVDVTMGVFLPGEFSREHHLELSAGWYTFTGNQVEDINGFRIQLDGEIVPTVNAQVAVTHDEYFGPNATVGISWRFGNRDLQDTNLDRQLRRFVRRNHNVIVGEWEQSGTDIPLINPLTGEAYIVQHVSSASLTGNGTVDSPFRTLADAQAEGADIIFVHGDTTLNESIALNPGQMLLGAGAEHALLDQNFGRVLLAADASPGAMPTLLNSAVNAITMNDDTTVAGFVIQNPNGAGIVADGITNFEIRDVTIRNANGHGIFVNDTVNGSLSNITIEGGNSNGLHITNIDDVLTLDNIAVSGVAGTGVHIEGGQGEITFLGDLELRQNQGIGLLISDLFTTTVVDDQGTTTTTDDVTTVTEGTVVIENLILEGADGATGVELRDNDGLIAFADVDITTTNGPALLFRNTDRAFIGSGDITAVGAAAIDIEDSFVDLRLQSLNANGGTNAIRMIDTDGRIVVFGTGGFGTGGLIQNTTVAIVMEGSEQIGLQTLDFANNGTLAQIENSTHFEMSQSDVTGTTTQFINALNLRTLAVANSDFTGNTLTADTGILFSTAQTGGHIARITGNVVTEGPRRFFHAQTLAGGESAALQYAFQSNDVDLTHIGGVAAGLDWTGQIQANVTNNLIQGTQASQIAFNFNAGNTNDNAIFSIQQNGIALAGQNSTGIQLSSDAPMVAQINQNLIQFNGLDGVGMRISSTKASTVSIALNQIDDFAGGATGILFPTMFDNSTIVLNGNLIDLSRADAFADRGIILSAVGGVDDPFVTFSSNTNNQILGATTIFSAPAGQVQGQVIINNIVIQ